MFHFKSYLSICLTLLYLNQLYDSTIAQEHECARTCAFGAPTRQCVYYFQVEWYYTMSKACYDCPDVLEDCDREDCVPADGRRRAVATINRQLPAPNIEVCEGDQVIVHVENALMTDATTIHWHGMRQRATPYMDGVPFITQCNIQPGTSFTYSFAPDQTGTHFYHSHSGMQRADGLFGAFVVRTPRELDPHSYLYDFDMSEHVIVVIDWEGVTAQEKYLSHYQSTGDNRVTNILVNGRGLYDGTDSDIEIPYQRFQVFQGLRYRFRLINAGALNCPIQLTVDNHTLTIISTDGNDIQPVEAESFISYAGERFDFIINANQENGVYWMKFKGLMDCRSNSVFQLGVLQYTGSSDDEYPDSVPTYDDITVEGLLVNPLNIGMEGSDSTLSMPELVSIEANDQSLRVIPDFQYMAAYNVYQLDHPFYHRENVYGYFNVTDAAQRVMTPQINHISMQFLSFPLLPGRFALTQNMVCDERTVDMESCEVELCSCTHVVRIPLGAVTELILVDENANTNHPIHLHGTRFSVIGMEKLEGTVTAERIQEMDRNGLLLRNFNHPAMKDTVSVPGGGYAIVRFVADNPGFWFMHCHLEFHAEVGMGLVFQVGENTDMLNAPVGFPTCGNYQ